jgi:23S rRNA (guanosine2251-2'-O)-methyltransferase
MKKGKTYIYGRHAVTEAVAHAPHSIRKVFINDGTDGTKVRALAAKGNIPVERLDPRKVTSYVEGNAPHQGFVAQIAPENLTHEFADFIEGFEAVPGTLLIFMSEVQDPHNVGAIIRSAAAFGASAVLMPIKNQSPITPAVVKASAGMAFRVPLVTVPNVSAALKELKTKGVRVYGLAGESEHSITDEPFRAPTMLVLGNEGAGLTGAARAACELLLKIPMSPRAESLNVAASAAVAMYAWSIRNKKAVR